MVILNAVLFLLTVIFIFYFPGRYLLRRFQNEKQDYSITVAIAFSVGIGLYLIVSYLLSWIGLSKLYYIFVLVTVFLEFPKTIKELKSLRRLDTYSWFLLFLLLLGTTLMSYIMFFSGSYDKEGSLLFYGVNSVDAIWHITLIENLSTNFPPTHPGLSDIPLRGYNFFYDFLLANIKKLYPFSSLDLYFRYFAFFLALLFGISSIALARFLRMGKSGVAIFLFLSYFAQGFGGYILSYLQIPYTSPIVQSIAHAVDPNVILSLVLLYVAYILLFSKKHSYLAVLVLSVLPMIKIYTAILAFGGLGIVAIIAILRYRDFSYFIILTISALLAAILYLPINFGAGSLIFAPFLLYKHYMESGTILPSYQWILKYQVYEESGSVIRIAQLYLISLFFFFIPTLGIRLVSVLSIKNLFQKNFYSLPNIFFISVILIGLLIPSFFIQSVAVFVTVQFIWLIYVVLLVPTAYTIEQLLGKLNKVKVIVTAALLILLCLPETIAVLSIYSNNPLKVNSDLIKVIKSLPAEKDGKDILVLNDAFVNQYNSGINAVPIVSALSGRSTYYEPEVLEFMHMENIIDKRRSKTVQAMQCADKKSLQKALDESNVSYIVAYKPYLCLNTLDSVRKIHTSGAYSLYEVKTE